MICVFLLFLVFCISVVWSEIRACLDLVCLNEFEWQCRWNLVKRCIVLTQTQYFSGNREERYLIHGKENPSGGYAMSNQYTPVQTHTTLYSRITQWNRLEKVFTTLDAPVRMYNVEEIRDILPFLTRFNWSLEKMYCRDRSSRMIAAIKGPSALLPSQIKSSLVCTTLGLLLSAGLVVGALVWIETRTVTVVLTGVLIGVCCVTPVLTSSLNLYRVYYDHIIDTNCQQDCNAVSNHGEDFVNNDVSQVSMDKTNESDNEDTMFQVWETLTVTKPKLWYCWGRFALHLGFLFLWPLITLYSSHDYKMGTVFLFLGFFSSMRIHFDVTFILSELGSMNDIDVPVDSKNDEEKNGTKTWFKNIQERIPIRGRFVESKDQRILLAKARISEIIGKISRSRTAGRWMWFYGVFAVVALIMMLSAADTDVTTPEGGRPPIVQLADFYYPAQPDLAYPSCEMTKGFTLPGNTASRLGDYAFLAALSYETPNTTQHHLNTWFGNDTIVDEAEFVAHYREETETTANPVYYKLLSIPSIPGYGIVSIRGSQTTWDFLVDAQLWSAAGLVQVVQAFIPFGWIWTPILDNLVTGVNFIESAQLKKVSYYRLTTDFINALLEDDYTYGGKAFNTIRITGASLGGGLAIISGAQTNASAIAISGLNGVLSRNTFIPKVTEEQLNTHVFNVIPDRDIIALVGGRSRLFQEIECRAGKNNLLGCHSMWRSVCEINFQCGSGGRPILCRCVNTFGYPKPLPTGSSNRTFEEACEEEESFLLKEGLT